MLKSKYIIFLIILSFLAFSNCSSPKEKKIVNRYEVDLTNSKSGKIKVKYFPEFEKKDSMFFSFSYENHYYRYGGNVENLIVIGKNSDTLEAIRAATDNFFIPKSSEIKSIEYEVNHSWYSDTNMNILFSASILFDSNLVFAYWFQVLGYFEEFANYKYNIQITKPDFLFGTTSLNKKSISDSLDIITGENFNDIISNPILYCVPDTLSFNIDSTNFFVSTYSDNKNINSDSIKEKLFPIIKLAKNKYLKHIKIDSLKLIFIFQKDINIFASTGNCSSKTIVLCLSPYFSKEDFEINLYEYFTHELLHQRTPYHIASTLDVNFNILYPENRSKHAWFTEGITEYHMYKILLDSKKITEEEFFNSIGKKLYYLEKNKNLADSLSLTEFSKLKTDSSSYTSIIYSKGAVVSFMLDILINEKSNGEKDLNWLINTLAGKYNRNNKFEEDSLFDIITELTYPEIGVFLKKYVENREQLPIEEYLNKIGCSLKEDINHSVVGYAFNLENTDYFFKNDTLNFTNSSKCFFQINFKEFQILSINGEKVDFYNFNKFILYPTNNDNLKLEILYKNKKYIKEVWPAIYSGRRTFKIEPYKNPSNNQKKLLNDLLLN
ncbi:MAG: hypothetical protein K9J13_12080 [Saprospiraceae bacterium]|nr:hypothetical protein [Saprospiraceae bacterium]